jgi:hypothetical protein
MSGKERKEFQAWYESQKPDPFDNRRVLGLSSQDDVTVLRQPRRVFSREFLQIGYIEFFLESITIASACT